MNEERLKIVYLLDWFLFYATELANAMAEEHDVLLIPRDHDLEVSSPEQPMPLREYLEAAASKKVRLDHIRYRRADPRSILEVIRLQKHIASWGADVIHIQDTVDWRVILLAVLNRHRQVVVTIHDIEAHPGDDDYRRPYALLFRLLLRSAKKIIVHGEGLRDQLMRRFPTLAGHADVAALPNGAFSLYRAWDDPSVPEEPFTVLFFGRIVLYKGLEDLIAAQPLVTAAVPQARFVIAGGGPFEKYQSQIRDPAAFEIHNRFIPNSEIPRLIRRAAVVVLPYREASQSGVIPLAYEFGKPVVATRVGSLPEVVDDGGSGLLVDPGSPAQVAEAITRILKDPELRARLAAGAKRLGETRLSWKSIARETAKLYRQRGPAGSGARPAAPAARRKVVFVVPDLQVGGAERQVVDLVNHLDHDRFDATLFTFGKTNDLAKYLRGVRQVTVPREFKFDARPILALARLIRKERVELVHCTLEVSLFVAMAAVALSGRKVRVVQALHTTEASGQREELANRLLHSNVMRACDRIITVCEGQRAYWAKKYPFLAPKMTTIYNGTELEKYRDDVLADRKAALRHELGIEEGDVVMGMLAAIRPEKNHAGVLAAAARVVEEHPNLKLLFVGGAVPGTEDLEARLRRQTSSLGLDQHVRWLGMVADPKPVVSLFDASIQFSQTVETFPLALLESLAMGKPVVASRIGGVPEIVEDGKNGLLVPVGDVTAFASALSRICSDPELLRDLSAEARPSVDPRFSVTEMAHRTEEVMMATLNDAQPEGTPRTVP